MAIPVEEHEYTKRVRLMNDAHRMLIPLSTCLFTPGIQELSEQDFARLIRDVRHFKTFTEENDPYGEHDFGAVDLNGERFFWKIEYFSDRSYTTGSIDPSDPEKTVRMLVLMHASEY